MNPLPPQRQHCFYCFEALISHLEAHEADLPHLEDQHFPLFVTWKSTTTEEPSLRGCIGNFSPLPLTGGLKDYALIAALQDSRFHPVTLDEVRYLQCTVSLLTDFEPADDHLDWEVGTHGIRMELVHDGRRYSSTFLPEVAGEQGWTKIETLEHLLRKSGFRSKITSTLYQQIKITRYQSRKCTATYAEYLEYKSRNK